MTLGCIRYIIVLVIVWFQNKVEGENSRVWRIVRTHGQKHRYTYIYIYTYISLSLLQ